MATIPPGRLHDVTNAADHITLVADNFEILSEELFKLTPTFQNGAPNAVIGPPTSGERVLGELWKDSLGAWWRCTAAGTPGTWQQVLPAAVAADPASGTVADRLPGAQRGHGHGEAPRWGLRVGDADRRQCIGQDRVLGGHAGRPALRSGPGRGDARERGR